MTLGARLNTYLERHDRKQAEVALTWLEEWKKRNEKSWSDQTITSHLNRLLKDVPQGVRFFFEDRARGALLLNVLEIPEGEHPELFALADTALSAGDVEPPARLILDATTWSRG